MQERRSLIWPCVFGIVGVCAVYMAGVIILEWLRPDTDRGMLIAIAAPLLPTAATLVGILRSIANGELAKQAAVKAEEAKEAATASTDEIHANTRLTSEIKQQLEKMGP